MSINVAIIEDHKAFRDSLSAVLSTTEGFRCIGSYGSVEEALQHMQRPDVVLLDIHLPGISGIDGIVKIKYCHPGVHIVMVTVFDDDTTVFRAILAGADGYLLKKTPMMRILQAIEDAAAGGAPMSPVVAKQAIALFKNYVPVAASSDTLSDREREILGLIVQGLSNEQIADKLFVTRTTIRNHISHIYQKLHVHSKSQAVVKAIREGIV